MGDHQDQHMDKSPKSPEERYAPALLKAQAELKERDPMSIANLAGVSYRETEQGQGEFALPLWNEKYTVSYPEGIVLDATGQQPPIFLRLIALHYLENARGVPMADRWIAFRELPGGLGYNAVFEARVNKRLSGVFGKRLAAFRDAASGMGGMPLDVGDAAFAFDVFPRLRLAVVMYEGDDEFPPSANLIFDGAAEHYLPTEDLVVLGETVASKLTKYQAST